MKKSIFLGLIAVVVLAARPAYSYERSSCVKHIETCEAILQEFMGDQAYAIPTQVLEHAHGIVILNQFKAGFIFGATGGYGVIMVKRPDNTWSIPVLLRCGGLDFGLQAGGRTIESIFVLNDDETARRLLLPAFNVGVDAKAVAGPRYTEIEAVNKEILATPVLVYTKTKGLYAGAIVKTGFITRNDEANRTLYLTPYTLPELLFGNFVTPPAEVLPLMNYVKKIAP